MKLITSHLLQLGPSVVLSPIVLGEHINHRIAQTAAIENSSSALVFYEDLPYAAQLRTIALEQRAEQLAVQWMPCLFSAEHRTSWKAQYAAIYNSQSNPETVTEIADDRFRCGQEKRFWVTPQAANLLNSY